MQYWYNRIGKTQRVRNDIFINSSPLCFMAFCSVLKKGDKFRADPGKVKIRLSGMFFGNRRYVGVPRHGIRVQTKKFPQQPFYTIAGYRVAYLA
jgi:hypothetical protein